MPEQFLIFRIVGNGKVIGIRIILPLNRAEVVIVLRVIWVLAVVAVFGLLLTL